MDNNGNDNSTISKQDVWKIRAYAVWAVIGGGVAIAGILYVLGVIWQAVAATVIAAVIAFLFHAPVKAMESKGVPRLTGTLACLLALLGALAVLFVAVVPSFISETANLVSSIPDYVDNARQLVNDMSSSMLPGVGAEQVDGLISAAGSWATEQGTAMLSGMATGVIGSVIDLGTWLMIAFIGLLCSFWLLVDLPRISAELHKLVPENRAESFDMMLSAFGTAFYGWAKATIICAVLTGVSVGVVLAVLGVPYAALLAVTCAVMYFIPYLGAAVSAVLVFVAGLLVGPFAALLALILVLVIVNVIANMVAPRLMKSTVNMHPAVVLLVIMVGGGLLGVAGMLLSIPVAAAVQSVLVTSYEAKTGTELSSPDGALFRSQEPVDGKLRERVLEKLSWRHDDGGSGE